MPAITTKDGTQIDWGTGQPVVFSSRGGTHSGTSSVNRKLLGSEGL